MPHPGELWQEFRENGEPIPGVGSPKSTFAHSGKICATAHVWLWRERNGEKEFLLQRRSLAKDEFPGLWDISTCGHVNLGESPAEAAVREAREEIGLNLSPAKLVFVMTLPVKFANPKYNTFRHVFLYNLAEDVNFKFDDGEVSAVTWRKISDLAKMQRSGIMKPKEPEYWKILLNRLKLISRKNPSKLREKSKNSKSNSRKEPT